MCGIAGCFGDAPDEEWVNSVIVDLIPRGPDHQETSIINPSLVMGAARLAMTDPLPRSNQPFLREDLGIAITFNGEIYNYKELRFELAQLGYTFWTDSDTEVLLLAIHKYGENVTAKLNGMYAFAYFSNSLGTLLLGRDSLGKKPLYYSFNGSTFLWSSSLESINKKHGSEISDYGLNQYLAFGYTIDPDTILEKILL
jgi:asparagine synthase (glutamine-hydrolysing)